MSESDPHLGSRAGESIPPASQAERTQPIFKAAAWVLGGFSLLTAGLGALTVVPRIANGYLLWTVVAVGLIIAAFLAAMLAAAVTYSQGYQTETKWWRDGVRLPLGFAAVSLLTGITIVLLVSVLVLGRSEVPRLTLSITQDSAENGQPADTATMKLTFEADAMDPGGFMVVNVIGLLPPGDNSERPEGIDRLYFSVVGADATGRIKSEVVTEVSTKYDIVVAEVFPGPIDADATVGQDETGEDLTWAADLHPETTMCADIHDKDPRGCVYAVVPR